MEYTQHSNNLVVLMLGHVSMVSSHVTQENLDGSTMYLGVKFNNQLCTYQTLPQCSSNFARLRKQQTHSHISIN